MSAAADVLTELTGLPPWAPRGCDVRVIVEARRVGYLASAPDGFYNEAHGVTMWRAWTCDDTETAVDRLARAGLWPWPVGDDAAPRWWCEACRGSGLGDFDDEQGLRWPCSDCRDGHAAEPQSLASFVAVASLGVDTLRRAEGLALQLVGRAPRLTFRVMSREALRERAEDGAGRPIPDTPRTIMRASAFARDLPHPWRSWCSAAPLWLADAPDDVHRAWPVLRDLAALGLHLVALDGDRITLAVEAI